MNTENIKSSKLRFGLVGAGSHGRGAVIPAFNRSRLSQLVAVAEADLQNRIAVEALGKRCYSSVKQMLANEDLDALYIATLPNTHCELALTAFEHGLHVVCEKPLAADQDEARQMLEAAKVAGKRLVVMFENRFLAHNIKVREWMHEGAIGAVEAIHLQRFGRHPTAQPRRTNLLNAAGCLDCGIHSLDLVRFWCGEGQWHEIHARGAWFGEAVKNPPHLAMMARFGDGVLVTFEDSFRYGYGLESAPWNFSRNSLTIVGERGVIVDGVVGAARSVELVSDQRRESVMITDTTHADEIPLVLDQLAKELQGAPLNPSLATGEDGLVAQEAVDLINAQCRDEALWQPDLLNS